jgi:integrase
LIPARASSLQFHDVPVSAGLALARPPKWKAHGKGRESPRVRSDVTFHSLRHTATSLLKNAGVSGAVARDIIGHESAAISGFRAFAEKARFQDQGMNETS